MVAPVTPAASVSNQNVPGTYEINSVMLLSYTGMQVEMKYLVDELNIYEDIFQNAITADLFMNDSVDLTKNIPLMGHEEVYIEFRTSGYSVPWKHRFFIYKISERSAEEERKQSFVLHLASFEVLTNTKKPISQAWYMKEYDEILKDIFKDYLKVPEKYADMVAKGRFEKVKYKHNMVIPSWLPFRTLNWLATRAVSNELKASNYLFFENQDGYSFRSLEDLFEKERGKSKPPPVPTTKASIDGGLTKELTYIYQPANYSDRNTNEKDVLLDMVAMERYVIKDGFNILDNLSGGLYGSEMITHDMYNKEWKRWLFDYYKTFPLHKHMEPAGAAKTEVASQEYKMLCHKTYDELCGSSLAHKILFPKHKKIWDKEAETNHCEEWLQLRVSSLQQLAHYKLGIIVPGDSTRKVGEVVKVEIPSVEQVIKGETVKKLDKYYSGYYLITSLRHSISTGRYKCHMELVKDTFGIPMPDVGSKPMPVEKKDKKK